MGDRRPRAGRHPRHHPLRARHRSARLRRDRRLRLPRVAQAQRRVRALRRQRLRARALRPGVRLRRRRRRQAEHRGGPGAARRRARVLHVPRRLLLEDAGRHGRRRVRAALRGARAARRALRVLPSTQERRALRRATSPTARAVTSSRSSSTCRPRSTAGAEYEPLVDVRGLPCWPSTPDYAQLVGRRAPSREKVGLRVALGHAPRRPRRPSRSGETSTSSCSRWASAPCRTCAASSSSASARWREMVAPLQVRPDPGLPAVDERRHEGPRLARRARSTSPASWSRSTRGRT